MKEVKDVLKALLESYERGGNPLTLDWLSLVGEELAQHSRFIDYTGKTLIIEVSHSGWKQVFMLQKKEIMDRISKFYPDFIVEKVIINISKVEIKKRMINDRVRDKETDPNKPEMKEIIDKVSNEEFREYLKNLNKRIDSR